MSRKSTLLLLALLVAALVAGCSPAPAPAPVPPTKTPKPTFTSTAVPTEIPFATAQPIQATAEAVATAAAEPTQAPTATTEPTAAPTPEAIRLTASQNVNVRSGPGTAYPAIGRLTAGESFVATGRNDEGDWVQFDFNGKDGWATAALLEVSGDLNGVEVAQAPAIPTPRPQPTARPRPPAQPTNPPAPAPPPAPPAPTYPFQYMQGSANCQPNAGTTYFDGVVRHRDNSLFNGACVHIAFYGPRQTKCSGCGGVGDGNWGFSPFGGPAPAGTTVEIFVVTCDGVPVGGQDQSTGFSDLTPKSDKWVHTINSSEQCTGITFVGD